MISQSDFLAPPRVLVCGLGLMVDGLCCLFTLARYRTHLYERFLYRGEPQAAEFEWLEEIIPVSTFSYANREQVHRASRTHSRFPFAMLALTQLADGMAGVASLGFVQTEWAVDLQFSHYWADATQPWFRVNSAIAVSQGGEIPVLNYIGVDKT